MGEFLIAGISNDDPRDAKQLSSFRAELEDQIRTHDALQRYGCVIHEVTQLVDEDLGDCFVVGLAFGDDNTGDDEEEDTSNVATAKDSSELVMEALFGSYHKAEIWVTSAGAIPLAPPYGWKMKTFQCEQGNHDSICNRLRTYGLAIIANTKNADEETLHTSDNQQKLRIPTYTDTPDNNEQQAQSHHEDSEASSAIFVRATTQLQEHVALLERTVRENHPHIRLGESAFGFQEYTHRGPGRFEVLFEQTSSLYTLLRDELEARWIESVCQYLQQPDRSRLRLNISCVYSRPGATDQDWHTDGDHYNSGHGTTSSVGDRHHHSHHLPYAVCIFAPLIPLTPETGYTRFWPKSHLYPNLLGLARAADACLQATIDGVHLQSGDFVMYDYTTWHKGIGNTTNDTERPIIQFLYSCDWYKEKKNYGTRSVFDTSEVPKKKLSS
jgi:hypothetical protein